MGYHFQLWLLILHSQSFSAAPSKSIARVPSTLKFFQPNQKTEEAQSWNEQSERGRELIPTSAGVPPLLAVLQRVVYLWIIFTPVFATAPAALWSFRFRNAVWFRLVCWSLARGGAAWIKWAQWGSTRPDILPEQLCARLARLQTSAPEHSFYHTRAEIEHAFGRPLEDVFSRFDHLPVASGSIAQVHFATYEGKRVAVKVRHPGVALELNIDFRIMKRAAEVASKVPGLKWLNLEQSVEAFSHTMTGQTFLDVEGNHLAIFNHNFGGWNDVFFPEPLVASEAVLVETFENGRLVSDFTGLDDILEDPRVRKSPATSSSVNGQGISSLGESSSPISSTVPPRSTAPPATSLVSVPLTSSAGSGGRRGAGALSARLPLHLAHFVVTRGEDLYLKMLLLDGLMHADLHPGNILVSFSELESTTTPTTTTTTTPESSSSEQVPRRSPSQIVLVDAGMVANLREEEQAHFIGLLECMVRGDGRAAAQHVLQFSSKQTCTGRAETVAFSDALDAFFATSCRGYGTGIDLATVLRGVLSLVRVHGVRIDVNYATLVMNALCLDGLAKALLPHYNIMDAAAPLLRAYVRFQAASSGSAFGRGFLRRVAIPLAMRRKRRHDERVRRRLARLGLDPTKPLSPASESLVRRLLSHRGVSPQ